MLNKVLHSLFCSSEGKYYLAKQYKFLGIFYLTNFAIETVQQSHIGILSASRSLNFVWKTNAD